MSGRDAARLDNAYLRTEIAIRDGISHVGVDGLAGVGLDLLVKQLPESLARESAWARAPDTATHERVCSTKDGAVVASADRVDSQRASRVYVKAHGIERREAAKVKKLD